MLGGDPPVADEQRPRSTRSIHHKTVLCRYWRFNRCLRGDTCGFAHGEPELRPAVDLTCTKLCPWFREAGYCGDRFCRYAHGLAEVRTVAWAGAEARPQLQMPAVPAPVGEPVESRLVETRGANYYPGAPVPQPPLPVGEPFESRLVETRGANYYPGAPVPQPPLPVEADHTTLDLPMWDPRSVGADRTALVLPVPDPRSAGAGYNPTGLPLRHPLPAGVEHADYNLTVPPLGTPLQAGADYNHAVPPLGTPLHAGADYIHAVPPLGPPLQAGADYNHAVPSWGTTLPAPELPHGGVQQQPASSASSSSWQVPELPHREVQLCASSASSSSWQLRPAGFAAAEDDASPLPEHMPLTRLQTQRQHQQQGQESAESQESPRSLRRRTIELMRDILEDNAARTQSSAAGVLGAGGGAEGDATALSTLAPAGGQRTASSGTEAPSFQGPGPPSLSEADGFLRLQV